MGEGVGLEGGVGWGRVTLALVIVFGIARRMFSKSVWTANDSAILLREASSNTDSALANVNTRHKPAVITIGVGDSNAEVDRNVSIFLRPRTGNSFCYIDMVSIYAALKLNSYEGYGSRWVNKTYHKWLSKIKECMVGFEDELFVHSLHAAEKEQATKKNEMPWERRCLNRGSLCVSGLYVLLARFIALKPQGGGGGLDNLSAKKACTDLLASLLQVEDHILY